MKTMFLAILLVIGALVAAIFLTVTFSFSSKDHSEYDLPRHPSTGLGSSESLEHAEAAKLIVSGMNEAPKQGRDEMMRLMRQQMDERGESIPIGSEIHPVNVDGMDGEWVIAPNATSKRRLLYIHGGGYVMGSPKSHRLITSRLSEVSGAAVLSIDYRLQPENSRMAGIEDCRKAYAWLLENSPDTSSSLEVLFVAGDSSGGNLALATIAWARDSELRAADAVVVFSPQTDATLESPSLVKNTATDVMQGRSFGPVVKAPKVFSLGFGFLMNRINPSNPNVSPLLGDLSNLPPTLVQVSEAEMFLDDAVRYVNKANAQGSPALLQTWPFVMHVWQAFQVPEADEAFRKVEVFLREHTPIEPVTNAVRE
ncbi:MAG: alpha/beta hydrolase [Halioglobus sp.]